MDRLASDILGGNRRALSRAITLAESTREDHRAQTRDLMARLTREKREALRIGLSGTPGVGKSTFIESFGLMLTGLGLRVAVLAVDPSSTRSGGSILGDKTRMDRLARDPNAFIRPSPSQSHLGGVARRSREAIAICEAAGFDVILIETVGVGQSETMVADMSDLFVLLLAPAGGDELQGVKRGIMEMADLIIVNKSDGDLAAAAARTQADYAGALRLLRKRPQDPNGFPKTARVSALLDTGMAEVWHDVTILSDWRKANGFWEAGRQKQAVHWFEHETRTSLLAQLSATPEIRAHHDALADKVACGELTPEAAAATLLAHLNTPT